MNRKNGNTQMKMLSKTANTRSWANVTHNQPKSIFQTNKKTHFLRTQCKRINLNDCQQKINKQLPHHFASDTQLMYVPPFYKKAYVPPHLNSSQVFNSMSSECKKWQIRPSSTKKLSYSNLYSLQQEKYQNTKACWNLKKRNPASLIKGVIDADRTIYEFRKPYKLYVEQQNSENDLSEDDSSIAQSRINSNISQSNPKLVNSNVKPQSYLRA